MAQDAFEPVAPHATAAQPAARPGSRPAGQPGWRIDFGPGRDRIRWRDLARAAIVVGVAAGFLEWAVFLADRDVFHAVSRGSQFVHRHTAWMLPLAGALGTAGLAMGLGAILRRLPSPWSGRAVGWLLGTLAVLAPALAVRGLHAAAALLLACGAGWRIATWAAPHRDALARSLRWACPLAIALIGGHVLYHGDRIARAETRGWAAAPAAPSGAKSVLWIVLDTVRADHLNIHGYGRETTPNLARWADRGVVFEQARSAAPWTLPSHMTMLSGLWPHEHGVRIDRPYSGRSPMLAEHFRDRGYATAGIVSNAGMVNACFGFDRGFGSYVDHKSNQKVDARAVARSSALGRGLWWAGNRLGLGLREPTLGPFRRAPEILAMAQSWRERRRAEAPGRPEFLFVNLMDAHGPYRPSEGRERAFFQGPIPENPRELVPRLGDDALDRRNAAPPEERASLQAGVDDAARHLADLYDECLRGLDADLGAFLDGLDARGELDDTWIVVTADHGEHFGEHDRFGHGNSLYDGLLHVPLLLIPPRSEADAPRGVRVAPIVSLRNLPATVAGLALPGVPHPFPGESLAALWSSPASAAAPWSDPTLAELERQTIDSPDAVKGDTVQTSAALFSDGKSYLRIDGGDRAHEFLFDLATDPLQLRNLFPDPAADRLRDDLDRLMTPGRE